MALLASGYVNDQAIESAVRETARRFAPDVVRIGYTIEDNHWGDPSVSFRVLVVDEVAKPLDRLMKIAHELPIAMMNELRTEETGLQTYFNYRTVSEQQRLREPIWD